MILAAALLLAGCGPRVLVNSDDEPVGWEAVRDGRALIASGDASAALTYWTDLLAAHPDSWEAARGLQDTRRATLPADAFERLYREAVESQPGDGLAWYLWGRARIDSPNEAARAFQKAGELAPMRPWPPAGLAFLAWREGDLFRTVETYEAALEEMPRSATLRHLLGNQLMTLRMTVSAQRELETARRLAPDNPAILGSLGQVYMQVQREEEGRALLEESWAKDPGRSEVAMALAQAYIVQRRVDDAEAMYRKALELGMGRDEELYAAIRAARVVERSRGN